MNNDPSNIMQTAFGFWSSKVLLTAVEFDLFTVLGENRLTAEQIRERLNLHPRSVYDFLDALVALKLLGREGNGAAGLYHNSPEAEKFLRRDSPMYIGGIMEMLNARLFRFWDDLPEALRTGTPQNEGKHGQKPLFEALYEEDSRLEQFLSAMAGISRGNFEQFAEKFDFSRYQTLCDAGGASGLLSVLVAKNNPHMTCLSFDLPKVAPIARHRIKTEGLEERVRAVSGDFFKDPLPKADVITMGLILHDWDEDEKRHLIRAAYEALPEGGAFVAIENLIDDERRENLFGLLMSLNMLIETQGGFDFTGADFRRWCTDVGFQKFEVMSLSGPSSAAIAYK